MDYQDMSEDEFEMAYEAADEHRNGCHYGSLESDCPLCNAVPDTEMVSVACDKCFSEQVMVLASEARAGGEFVCMGCMTGVNLLRQCVDCDVVLVESDQFSRWSSRETQLLSIYQQEIVCQECYLSNPGDGGPHEV